MIQRHDFALIEDTPEGEFVRYTDHLAAIEGYEKELLRVDKFWNKVVEDKDKDIEKLKHKILQMQGR